MAVTQVSKTDKPQGAATNGKGAGKPDEAASAFAKEVAAAIRAQELGAGDGGTSAAIALGWNVAALANVDVSCTAAAAGGAAAAGLLSLTEEQAVSYCVKQIEVAFSKLTKIVDAAKLDGTELEFPAGTLRECGGASAQQRADKAA